MQISDFLQPENIILDLSARSKTLLLQALAARAAKALGLDETVILAALGNREKLGSTGMGKGIAIPHATLPGIDKPFALLARLSKPVDFDAVDDAPVDVVLLLLNPPNNAAAALSALSCMAKALRDPAIVTFVRSSGSPVDIHQRIISALSR